MAAVVVVAVAVGSSSHVVVATTTAELDAGTSSSTGRGMGEWRCGPKNKFMVRSRASMSRVFDCAVGSGEGGKIEGTSVGSGQTRAWVRVGWMRSWLWVASQDTQAGAERFGTGGPRNEESPRGGPRNRDPSTRGRAAVRPTRRRAAAAMRSIVCFILVVVVVVVGGGLVVGRV